MATGSNIPLDVPESQPADNNKLSTGSSELNGRQLSRTSSISLIKGSITSTSAVHELLECPVCTNSMYPPIHQVSFFGLLCTIILHPRKIFHYLIINMKFEAIVQYNMQLHNAVCPCFLCFDGEMYKFYPTEWYAMSL